MALAPLATFWTGAPLSFVEQLCMTSWVDAGHPVTLYSYEPIANVPVGIEYRDASEILPRPDAYTIHPRTGSPAPFSDRFRYHLLQKRPGIIWVDTDAYCLRPFQPKDGYLFGTCGSDEIATGVLALPSESPALAEMTAYCDNPYAVLPWLPPKLLDEACLRAAAGDPQHVTEHPWGIWGPSGMTYLLKKSGEARHTVPSHVLYPVPYQNRRLYFKRASLTWATVKADTQSIHFYGRRVRDRLKSYPDGLPPRGSILSRLGMRHGLLNRSTAGWMSKDLRAAA